MEEIIYLLQNPGAVNVSAETLNVLQKWTQKNISNGSVLSSHDIEKIEEMYKITFPIEISVLPTDVMGYILKSLKNPADCALARAVCRAWENIIEEPTFNGMTIEEVLAQPPTYILWLACSEGCIELAKYALKELNAPGKIIPPLHIYDAIVFATYGNAPEIVELLFKTDAMIAIAGTNRHIAELTDIMIIACENKAYKVAEILLQHGANNLYFASKWVQRTALPYTRDNEALVKAIIQCDISGDCNYRRLKYKDIKPAKYAIAMKTAYICRNAELAKFVISCANNEFADDNSRFCDNMFTDEFVRRMLKAGGEWSDSPASLEVLSMMIDRLADPEETMRDAIANNCPNFVMMLITCGTKIEDFIITDLIKRKATHIMLDIIPYLREDQYLELYIGICRRSDMQDFAVMLMGLYKIHYVVHVLEESIYRGGNNLLETAREYIPFVRRLLECCPGDRNDYLGTACQRGDLMLVFILIGAGATRCMHCDKSIVEHRFISENCLTRE